MGMQVHFSIEGEEGIEVTLCEGCEDYYTVEFPNGAIVNGTSSDKKSFWFDCGSLQDWQISNIRKLIANRICFNVS
jgi:hypothetical protein